MTAAPVYLPNIAAACDRIVALDRAENIRAENAQKLRDARAALRSPSFYSNDELREFCVTLKNSDDPTENGMDWLNADAMIYTLNRNEFIARNCPRPETPVQVAMRFKARWPEVLMYAAFGAVVILKITGWM